MTHYEIDPEIRARFAHLSPSRFDAVDATVRTPVVAGQFTAEASAALRSRPLVVDDPAPPPPVVEAYAGRVLPVRAPRAVAPAKPKVGRPPLALSPETIKKLRDQHMPYARIAKRLGCSESAIYRLIERRPKLEGRNRYGKIEAMTDEALLEMRGRGMKLQKIAEHFGCTDGCISKRLKAIKGQ